MNETVEKITDSPAELTTFNYETTTNQSIASNETWVTLSERIIDTVMFYYLPLLVLGGSIGNILSVMVFYKTKLRKLSSSYYLAALGVSDTCFLLTSFCQWFNFVNNYNLYNQNIFCQFFTYLSYLSNFLSVWYVVAFTVERFIAVLYPLKRQTMCTVRRAKIVLCGLTVVGSVINFPMIVYSNVVYTENSTTCGLMDEYKDDMKIFNYVDTAVVFVIPLTSIIILNTFTGYTVWRVAGVRRTMTTHKRKTTSIRENKLHPSIQKCTHPNGNHSTKQSCPKTVRQKITNSSQMKVTKMLLIISSVFVCLNLPSYVARMLVFLEKDSKPFIVLQYFAYIPYLTNFGINFILYCVSGQNFRKAILSMFRKSTTQRQQEGVTQFQNTYEAPDRTHLADERSLETDRGTKCTSYIR
ncbi:thyrotropin-releasing hormone receptor isoform X2 [Bradysia coprophila]|uniref:thyrotropin-releasing hormone receptor isoform X2 n=1 Tax=Bradysia coprophila TaxID=38358 RepID=UPI00187D9D38|nr:thyrotropin-releasing hormone receptor isoform X2 [Bradysia coprophila]